MKTKLLIGILITMAAVFALIPMANAQVVGQKNWFTAIGSSAGYEEIYGTYVDSSGIYVMGSTDQSALFGYDHIYGSGTPTNNDVFITKLDSTGTTKVWTTVLASTGTNAVELNGLYLDSAHNVYITGYTDSTGFSGGTDHTYGTRSSYDTFVTKLDPTGAKLWTTIIASAASKRDQPDAGIIVDGSGNVFIAGFTDATTGFAGGTTHSYGTLTWGGMYIVKLDTNGVKQWATVAGDNGQGSSGADGIIMDGSGNIYVVGNSNDHAISDNTGSFAGGVNNNYGTVGGSDAIVMKLDSTGAKLWTTAIGSSSSGNADYGRSIYADAGFIYAIGYTGDSSHIGGTPDKTYGTTGGSNDAFVFKLDSTTGAKQWITVLASTTGSSQPQAIVYGLDRYGNNKIYVTGDSGADFAGGPGTTYGTLNTGSNYNIFLVSMDTSGNLVWNTMIGSGASAYPDVGGGVFLYQNQIYISGSTDTGSGIAAAPDNIVGTLGNQDGYVGNLQEIGYWTVNSQTGYTFTLPNGTDVSSNGQATEQMIYVNNTTANKIVGELDINFSAATGDITLPNITSGSDAVAGKALFHNGSAYPSSVLSRYLLVPNTTGNPYHCPSAATMADISTSCTGVDLSPTYTTVTIGGQVYFKMQNQGGGNQGSNQSGGGGEGGVPEFNDYALFAILGVAAVAAIGFNRKRL